MKSCVVVDEGCRRLQKDAYCGGGVACDDDNEEKRIEEQNIKH